jgi:hypothetical protein
LFNSKLSSLYRCFDLETLLNASSVEVKNFFNKTLFFIFFSLYTKLLDLLPELMNSNHDTTAHDLSSFALVKDSKASFCLKRMGDKNYLPLRNG